jgi:MmyB-like transcription regulator ligand binding domain
MSVVNADNQRLMAAAVAELFGTGDVEAMAPLLREGFVDHRPGVVASSKAGWLAAARKVPLASMQLVVPGRSARRARGGLAADPGRPTADPAPVGWCRGDRWRTVARHQAVITVVRAHEPYPAVVIARRWNIVVTNRAAEPFLTTIDSRVVYVH